MNENQTSKAIGSAIFLGFSTAVVRILITGIGGIMFLVFPYFYFIFLPLAYSAARSLFKKYPKTIGLTAFMFVVSFIFFDKLYYFISPVVRESGGPDLQHFLDLQKEFVFQIAPIAVILGVILAVAVQIQSQKRIKTT